MKRSQRGCTSNRCGFEFTCGHLAVAKCFRLLHALHNAKVSPVVSDEPKPTVVQGRNRTCSTTLLLSALVATTSCSCTDCDAMLAPQVGKLRRGDSGRKTMMMLMRCSIVSFSKYANDGSGRHWM
jgi:hypothetical protein